MDGKSKYETLAGWLKEQAASGRLRAGDRVPSENALCRMFGLSRQTVRQAIGLLEREGLLVRRRGSGTYIAPGGPAEPPPAAPAGQNIAVIMTYLDEYIFPAILKGIESVLAGRGLGMLLAVTHNQPAAEARVLRGLLENRPAGLIVEPTKSGLPNLCLDVYRKARADGLPTVFVNASYPGLALPCVSMDDRAAGRTATRHLLAMGHRRIAGMFKADDRQGHLRYQGYAEALAEAGLDSDPRHVLWFTTEDIPHLEADMGRVQRYLEGCTGLVCYNDHIAYPLCRHLRRRGVDIPGALSVVGIDRAEITAPGDPPLTTLAHPMRKLGESAARAVLALVERPDADVSVIFEPELIARGSVRRMAGGTDADLSIDIK